MEVKRESWEREAVFDELWMHGGTELFRQKFVMLGEQTNWSQAAINLWLEHWRKYTGVKKEDLNFVQAGEKVFLWRIGSAKVGPKKLSD